MKFIEETNNLFNYEGKAWLAHCISSDFAMGDGIATQFNGRYNLKKYMTKNYFKGNWTGQGYCIPIKEYKVFNLITKEKYFKKPTYKSLNQALTDMKNYAVAKGITKIAMPIIGCGLDKLDWNVVRRNIKYIFEKTNITIIVCKL